MRRSVRLGLQTLNHAAPISLGPVLADLPFALETGDLDFKADDPAGHGRDEAFRRVGDLPRGRPPRLVDTRQILDLLPQPASPHRAIGVDDRVVPGRHHLAGLALGLVPGRGYVAFRALEDDERLLGRIELAPLRVRARDMGP